MSDLTIKSFEPWSINPKTPTPESALTTSETDPIDATVSKDVETLDSVDSDDANVSDDSSDMDETAE